MSVPYTGNLVQAGADRATLVRRTYGLVFVSVVVTAIGVVFGQSQPALMSFVSRHPFISMIALFAPLLMAMSARRDFPRNIILTLIFTFVKKPEEAFQDLAAVAILVLIVLIFGVNLIAILLRNRYERRW